MKHDKTNVALVVGGGVALLIALAVCGGGGLLVLAARSQSGSGAVDGTELDRQRQERNRESAPTTSSSRSCTLRIPGEPSMRVPVFERESDYDDWSEAAVREDTHGQAEAIRSSGMLVTPGTKCKRLEGFISVKVRILEGPFEGRAGWTPSEWAR